VTATSDADAGPPASRWRLRAPRFALALPAWFWYLFFFLIPLGFIAYYSLGYKPAGGSAIATDRLSFDRYSEALKDPFTETFLRTLRISVIGTLLCLVIAFPIAYFLAVRVSQRWKGVLLALVIVPFWTSFLVRTIAWRIVFAPKGFLSNWLQAIGVRDSPFNFLDSAGAVQLGVVYNYLPLMILPLFVALDRIDPALREASKDLGSGRVRTFLQVTLPLAMPGVIAGLLLVFIPLSGDYITASVLGGLQGNMVGALVASQFQAAQNWARGSAMAMLLIGMILAAIAIVALAALGVRTLVRRRRRIDIDGVEVSARHRTWTPPPPVVAPAGVGAGGPVLAAPVAEPGTVVPAPTPPPRRRRRFDLSSIGLAIWSVLVYGFLFLPILYIVIYSFNAGSALLGGWAGWSTQWYPEFWSNEQLTSSIKHSLTAAIGSTILAVVIGGLAGVALARRPGRWRAPFLAIVFLVLVTPEIVDAIGYLIWFVRLGGPFASPVGPFSNGFVRMWVSHSVFSSAVVALIVRARLAGLDESLEEAAADLGAPPARAFRQITLPLMAPALLAGGLLSFTFSLDNTIVSTFVGTAGSSTFPMYRFSKVRSVLHPDVAAASTVLLGVTLVALGLVAFVLRRSGDSSSDVAATLTGT
jgi:ABC-type spermidine/putrescine transport system permease subunit I